MTTTIIIVAISLLLFAVLYMHLVGRNAAIKKENEMLGNELEAARLSLRAAADAATEQQAQREQLLTHIAALESENRAMGERLDAQKEQFKNSLEQMRLEFKNMAAEALQRNSEQFGKQSQEHLASILQPFNIDLKSFREKVDSYYGEESKQRFSLQENIKSLIEANQRISQDAVNLTNAIAGTNNNKFQGDWGETILEQILENSGLIEGEQWEKQATLRDDKGTALHNEDTQQGMKPDIIVHFPGKRDIIIDSKVSLKAYMAYLAAEDEETRARYRKEHTLSLRRHVDNLASKSYAGYNCNSLNYVMLFVPNEPSYFLAMETDNKLWNYAYKRGIVLISASNLISTLFVVNSLWTRERQQRDVQKIVDTANAVYEKVVLFTENFSKIENALEKASDAYHEAYKQLATGKGNITRRLNEIKEQGLIVTHKQIPDHYLLEE
ncbi:MAG: DNA recombination protein RmuC [Bacteroidaceae bacterium]|nr:DNA recombination protein RmuC [Bacteroidaceae bacterium]